MGVILWGLMAGLLPSTAWSRVPLEVRLARPVRFNHDIDFIHQQICNQKIAAVMAICQLHIASLKAAFERANQLRRQMLPRSAIITVLALFAASPPAPVTALAGSHQYSHHHALRALGAGVSARQRPAVRSFGSLKSW
jgi:hypothetical protein